MATLIGKARAAASGKANSSSSRFQLELPEAPASESLPVKAWEQPVAMRTWEPAVPDRNPLFLEKRVYQGSSGRVYPLPVIDRIGTEPEERLWNAIHIENEYLRFMVLPELGGRIHVGLDKINGYDFFYRQNVIKPALVGLAGPWISGGVEFNWPQHHRPATFMSVDWAIERDPDGSVTVWCSDHDPLSRMKGMHGLCLRPGHASLELRVRLYNRTLTTRTFLWWANAAVSVHERYQSFFPPDVRYVADHAKRAITEFPLSQGEYYGIPYGQRARHGIREDQRSGSFIPDGSCPANDLSWYANIPVPTSYMVAESKGDYFGGYDHRRNAGLVHVANHHIAPGKKQWTWGNHEFGYAWDRHLTESDGPYIELMAGVYTDNQPDFAFLGPGETKSFSQFWYPLRETGVPHVANADAAMRLERDGDMLCVHLLVTRRLQQAILGVYRDGEPVAVWEGDLRPEAPLHQCFRAGSGKLEVILEQAHSAILKFRTDDADPLPRPDVASEPPVPPDVGTIDELVLIGQHLDQYRHPTRAAEDYWNEAVRRDPLDSRANLALGKWHLGRGEFVLAESRLRASIARLTARNRNPADGEPHYHLGLALMYAGRYEDSYSCFYKSTWNAAWRAPAYHRLAEIDCARQEWKTALNHLDRALTADAENLAVLNLKSLVLRKMGRPDLADGMLRSTRALDCLDAFSRFLDSGMPPEDGQQRLDLVFDLVRAGLLEDALSCASPAKPKMGDGSSTMLLYVRAYILERQGCQEESSAAYHQASAADPGYVFPSRLEEMLVLEQAIRREPLDARAPYYLGNLLYDRRRHEEAIALWERSVQLDPACSTAWRNLGFAYYNLRGDSDRARHAFSRARSLAPHDARILYELDQLHKRTGESAEVRLVRLEADRKLVELRDDLSIELAALYNDVGRPEAALTVLSGRQFQPWEGGEGRALSQYVRSRLLVGRQCLSFGKADDALTSFKAATDLPATLGEAFHPLSNRKEVHYWIAMAYARLGSTEDAAHHWALAAGRQGDLRPMKASSIADTTYWSAMALFQLGQVEEAKDLLAKIAAHAAKLESESAAIDYFVTSLPSMLLFDEDLDLRQRVDACFLRAQAALGSGERERGIQLLHEVLHMDRCHPGAIDLLREQSL